MIQILIKIFTNDIVFILFIIVVTIYLFKELIKS